MTPHGALAATHRPPQILVAEDDPSAAEMLRIMLSSAGWDVRITTDGAAALAAVDEPPPPDIVLLDWMLPEVSGLDVCRRVRERVDALSLPILMVTAKADSESKAAAFEAGANDYITKPFLGAELRARIAAHLRVKQLSDERRLLDEHLMERDKLSTLGLLVSGVAHDLNNPLGGIYGYAQLLMELEVDPEKRDLLGRLLADARRCNRIVAELLGFARRHAPERRSVGVGDLLVRTLELRERHLRAAGILPRIEVEPGISTILADEHQLQQVFLNILVNAEHALRESGSCLEIRAGFAGAENEADDGVVTIRFTNDGPPIGPQVISRIFDPFFTTKGADEGTGLGLAICQRIVREHGGEIGVESGSDGTTFTITLPAAAATAPVPASHPMPAG